MQAMILFPLDADKLPTAIVRNSKWYADKVAAQFERRFFSKSTPAVTPDIQTVKPPTGLTVGSITPGTKYVRGSDEVIDRCLANYDRMAALESFTDAYINRTETGWMMHSGQWCRRPNGGTTSTLKWKTAFSDSLALLYAAHCTVQSILTSRYGRDSSHWVHEEPGYWERYILREFQELQDSNGQHHFMSKLAFKHRCNRIVHQYASVYLAIDTMIAMRHLWNRMMHKNGNYAGAISILGCYAATLPPDKDQLLSGYDLFSLVFPPTRTGSADRVQYRQFLNACMRYDSTPEALVLLGNALPYYNKVEDHQRSPIEVTRQLPELEALRVLRADTIANEGSWLF